MEKNAQTLSAMGARSRVIEVYEASEKAGDVAVVLGSAIEKLSAAADKEGKFSSAAVSAWPKSYRRPRKRRRRFKRWRNRGLVDWRGLVAAM